MNEWASVRVLMVDDHRDALEMLGRLVQLMGCEARACVDGARCIDAAKEFQPHVILLDLGMPRMDGYETAKAILALELPEFMLIALTGYGDAEHREKCAKFGFERVLLKPASIEQLREIIDHAQQRFFSPGKDGDGKVETRSPRARRK